MPTIKHFFRSTVYPFSDIDGIVLDLHLRSCESTIAPLLPQVAQEVKDSLNGPRKVPSPSTLSRSRFVELWLNSRLFFLEVH